MPVPYLQTLKTTSSNTSFDYKKIIWLYKKDNLTVRPLFRNGSWNLLIGWKQRKRATGNVFLRHKQKYSNHFLTKIIYYRKNFWKINSGGGYGGGGGVYSGLESSYILLHCTVLGGLILGLYFLAQNFNYNLSIFNVLIRNQFGLHFSI